VPFEHVIRLTSTSPVSQSALKRSTIESLTCIEAPTLCWEAILRPCYIRRIYSSGTPLLPISPLLSSPTLSDEGCSTSSPGQHAKRQGNQVPRSCAGISQRAIQPASWNRTYRSEPHPQPRLPSQTDRFGWKWTLHTWMRPVLLQTTYLLVHRSPLFFIVPPFSAHSWLV